MSKPKILDGFVGSYALQVEMDVIRDILDNQLVDHNDCKMGKVDGIVMELRDGQPPRLAYIEVGLPTLARRLHPRSTRWVAGDILTKKS